MEPVIHENNQEYYEQNMEDDHWYRDRAGEQKGEEKSEDAWMTEEVKIALARLHVDQIVKNKELFTMEVINDAYRKEIKKWHPDVDPEGTEVSKQLNDAYSLLCETYKKVHK